MTVFEWLIFFFVVQIIHGLGTWKLYKFSGHKSFEAFVPVYNAIVLMKIIRRPKWWIILLFIPVINLLIFPVIWVETARSFGKNSTIETLLVITTLGLYLYKINYSNKYDREFFEVSYNNKRKVFSNLPSLNIWLNNYFFSKPKI